MAPKRYFKPFLLLTLCGSIGFNTLAHNGMIAFGYPLGNITIDGNLSDWPANATRYGFTQLSKAVPEADLSGFFRIGYRAENQSLYIAFTITDESFVVDTSASVRYNTQDGLEVYLDARHLYARSGVASFMYSKTLHYINKAFFDPFTQNAGWEMVEVAMTQQGSTRFYEWRMHLGNELVVGKTIGFDFQVFDKDADSTFTANGWGKGLYKFTDANSIGDVILMPADAQPATVTGKINWDKPTTVKLPQKVQLKSLNNASLWVQVKADSLGNYSATLPAGKYAVTPGDAYYLVNDTVYATTQRKQLTITAKPSQTTMAPALVIPSTPAPDLIPDKGILHTFSPASTQQIDRFVETYRNYYNIQGVSLALIKDGKLVYHKIYGVRSQATGEKVTDSTLFEAASVTKPVFAHAVERLAERGVIDLDKPLYQYLPYKDIEYDERYKLMTGRHVLTHRTGFPNWRWMNADEKLDLKFTPGTAFQYSGEGFEYLKLVVEKITGKKVEQVLQEEVIMPIGLYHTWFSKNDSLDRLVSNGHFDGRPTKANPPKDAYMAYSMHTEAKIFTKFMLYLLEQKGLKASTYDTILLKHSERTYEKETDKPKNPEYFGMSLQVRETPFGKSFGHGGNNGDFRCQFEVYKDLKMGYVVFTNSSTAYPFLESMRKLLVEGK